MTYLEKYRALLACSFFFFASIDSSFAVMLTSDDGSKNGFGLSTDIASFGFVERASEEAEREYKKKFNNKDLVVSTNGSGFGAFFEYRENLGTEPPPLAFHRHFNGRELDLGHINEYHERVMRNLRVVGPDFTALDLRSSRMFVSDSDLTKSFPNLRLLAISAGTLGFSLDAIKIPSGVKVLIVEDAEISQSFKALIGGLDSLEVLVLDNCWLDYICPFPDLNVLDSSPQARKYFEPISGNLKYFVAENCSELIALEFLQHRWPKLEGVYMNLSFDFVGSLYGWKGYVNPSSDRTLHQFDKLKSVYLRFPYISMVGVGSYEEMIEKYDLTDETFTETQARFEDWVRSSIKD